MKEIGLKEVQQHLLSIAKEFDKICTRNNIPYFMLYGTMLGAVRHKGFIPWDDDMDFGVPIEYYKQMEEVMEKELPAPYRCCNFRNHKAVVLPFSKIEDGSTVIDDLAIDLPLEKKLGLNIDIFPLNRCNWDDKEPEKLKKMTYWMSAAFTDSKLHNSVVSKIVKRIMRLFFGGKPIYMQSRIEKRLYKVNSGDRIGWILGAGTRNTVPVEWYGEGKRYKFEDTSLVGPVNAHDYLKHIFGDYMQLPPESERRAHSVGVYLRDK